MGRASIRRALGLVLAPAFAATALLAQQHPQNTDFRNFTYPFPPVYSRGVPSRMTWMETNTKTTVTLVSGRHDFDANDPKRGPSVMLDAVHYGYLTMTGQLDAMVVLSYHTGGSAYWHYLYAFSLASVSPKLLGWVETGSRADSGLDRLMVHNGGFTVDLFDPDKRQADCCSSGFVRTRYHWSNGKFQQDGPPQFGTAKIVINPDK